MGGAGKIVMDEVIVRVGLKRHGRWQRIFVVEGLRVRAEAGCQTCS